MPNHLRTTTAIPPGEYFIKVIYRDGKESLHHGPCKGVPDCNRFGPSPVLETTAKALSAFRKANGIPRSSVQESLEDVSLYTCARLGGNPAWCFDTEKSYAQIGPAAARVAPCGGCGHTLQ